MPTRLRRSSRSAFSSADVISSPPSRTEPAVEAAAIQLGDVTVDLAATTATRSNGERIHLTPTEYRLLTALARVRAGPRQRDLTREERRRNLRGAFAAPRPLPARIALVDDVYTTGATVHFAASALRRNGARHVDVVTFSRTIRIR